MSTIKAVEYYVGDELEPLSLWWYATGNALIDFSIPYTYELRIAAASAPQSTILQKTTGFTGQAGSGTPPNGSPNLIVNWQTVGDLNSLPAAGRYICEITATRTSDSFQRTGRLYMDIQQRLSSLVVTASGGYAGGYAGGYGGS